jgi:hypothetical protein
MPACQYLANVLFEGSGTHTAVFPTVGSVVFTFDSLDSQVLPSQAPVISFTYSAHSLPLFEFVVSFSLDGIIVQSVAISREAPLAPFQSPVAFLIIASACSADAHFAIISIFDF